jgi:hypothetical protein
MSAQSARRQKTDHQAHKLRLNCRAVAALVAMHDGKDIPRSSPLKIGRADLFNEGLCVWGENGWVLTLPGKQLARHLTGRK